ncbi:MAG: glutaminyl-peptide cyclotransferase [Pseudohongiellaceae bacterium]
MNILRYIPLFLFLLLGGGLALAQQAANSGASPTQQETDSGANLAQQATNSGANPTQQETGGSETNPPEQLVARYGYRVVNSFPHDINAYTQGLSYHDGYLYESIGKYGQSTLSRLQLETGEVVQSRKLSRRYFGEGIEIIGERIYQLTWRENMVFVYDLESFEAAGTHYNPSEGWGLAFDGESLILSDGTANLQFLDPETFKVRREIQVTVNDTPLPNLNELEFINGEVWANVWQTDYIVRINPADGRISGIIDLDGLSAQTTLGSIEAVLNGIAWDEETERLFVTGKHWANLFEIELVVR